MNKPESIEAHEISKVLHCAVTENLPAVMTYLSKGKWHQNKVTTIDSDDLYLYVDIAAKENKHPVNIQVDQPVGISFKQNYSKYIFDSIVTGFEPSETSNSGGRIILKLPEHGEKLRQRSFCRVHTPYNLETKILFWHRSYHSQTQDVPAEDYWEGKLIDISAGGMQLTVAQNKKPNFKLGQLVGIQFTPRPYQKPVLLEAHVRYIAKSHDDKEIFLGLQFVGLETTADGREILHRLCEIVEDYYQLNHTERISELQHQSV